MVWQASQPCMPFALEGQLLPDKAELSMTEALVLALQWDFRMDFGMVIVRMIIIP